MHINRHPQYFLIAGLVIFILFPIAVEGRERAFVTQVDNASVAVIDLHSNTLVREIQVGAGNTPRAIAANGSGSRVAIGVHGPLFSNERYLMMVKFPDTPSEEIIQVPLPIFPEEIVFSPLGGRLYIAGADDTRVQVLSMSPFSLEILDSFSVSAEPSVAAAMAISPDGSQIFVAIDTLGDPQLLRLDVITDGAGSETLELGEIGLLDRSPGDGAMIVGGNGLGVWVTNADSRTVTEYDTTTLESLGDAVLSIGFEEPKALALSADGERLYVSSIDFLSGAAGTIYVFDRYGIQMAHFGIGEVDRPLGMDLDRSSSFLYVANQNSDTVDCFDTETHELVASVDVPGSPTSIVVTGPIDAISVPALGRFESIILALLLAAVGFWGIRRMAGGY